MARDYLAYDEVEAKRGEAATSEPKFDNPETTEFEETKPEKAKFELGALPAGVAENQVSVESASGVSVEGLLAAAAALLLAGAGLTAMRRRNSQR